MMGLDMYLNAERYLYTWNDESGDKELGENIAQLTGLPVTTNVKGVRIEAGYWRKANQIHNWFVNNVQDGKDECHEHDVSREQLTDLKQLCEKVLADNSLAESLLPISKGFFFGSDTYDQWYFNDLEDTIKIIDDALALPEQWDFTYRSSW